MPNDFLERVLKHSAKKRGLSGRHLDRYVHGAIENLHRHKPAASDENLDREQQMHVEHARSIPRRG